MTGARESNRGQALTTDAAAIAQRGFATLGRVTVKEAVLTFAPDFRWLILSFHAVFDLNCLPALPDNPSCFLKHCGLILRHGRRESSSEQRGVKRWP